MLLVNSMVNKLLEYFMKKNYKRLYNKNFRIEKVIKRKGNKLYVKWKRYDSSFNSWIDKKDLIKKVYKNEPNIFVNRMNHLLEILTLKFTCLIMQQKQMFKIFHTLILPVLH